MHFFILTQAKRRKKDNIQFAQRRYTNKQYKHEINFNIIREMENKITMRFHFTAIRMAIFLKIENSKNW